MSFPKFLKIVASRERLEGAIEKNTIVPIEWNVKLMEILSHALRFSYEIVYPEVEVSGKLLPNGSWTGYLGMLQRKEADMVVALLAVTEERNDAFLFSYPYDCEEATFITRKHESYPDPRALIYAFSPTVWFSVGVCVCIMPFVFRFLIFKKYSLTALFTLTVSSLLRQGTKLRPKKPREYVLMIFWLLFGVAVSNCYAAVLLSFVTFPSQHGIRTIKDLVDAIEKGDYSCMAYPGSFFASYFANSEDRSLQIIGRSLLQSEESADFASVLQNFTHYKKVAYIEGKFKFSPYRNTFFISDDVFFSFLFAIATRKDFCYKSDLDRVISRLWSAGIVKKVLSDYEYKVFLKKIWNSNSMDQNKPLQMTLSIAVFKGPFIFLLASYILSFFVFLLEICAGNIKREL